MSTLVLMLVAVGNSPSAQPQAGPAERQTDKLGKLMKKQGYTAVPLTFYKTRLFGVPVTVNDTSMTLVLDTGANNTNLDRASALRAKLAVREVEEKSSGLGGTFKSGRARIDRFTVGGMSDAAEVFVVDFSPTNATLKGNGDPPCDGVLGSHFLERHGAVIDYPSRRLFLRTPVVP